MILHNTALKVAIDLWHIPSQVPHVRSSPLPEGTELLLRIAAGEDEAMREAADLTDRSHERIGNAAAFFIEQVLLAPDADSYRVLGTTPEVDSSELRRNMALLTRWLHPDLDRGGERSIFVARVTGAWNDLKTPERRAAYDTAQSAAAIKNSRFRKRPRKAAMQPDAPEGLDKHSAYHSQRTPMGQARQLRPYKRKRTGRLRRAILSLFGRNSRR